MAVLKSDPVDALALIRNVLVHKMSVLDQTFIDASANVPSIVELTLPGLGKPMEITAGKTRTLIDSIIPIGYDLLHEVDSWMFAHP